MIRADDRNPLPPNEPSQSRGGRWYVLMVAAGFCLAGGWAAFLLLRPGPESWLDAARQELSKAGEPQSQKELADRCRRAETSLQRYLKQRGRSRPSAELLLCSVWALQGDHEQIHALFPRIDLNAISQVELLASALFLFNADEMGPADQILDVALGRPEDRLRTLRMAGTIRYEIRREDDALAHCRELADRKSVV